jgi:hypothetical protein
MMKWYVKSGALYETAAGKWTWLKSKAAKHDRKGGALPAGMQWSLETAPFLGLPRTQAGKVEAEVSAKFA